MTGQLLYLIAFILLLVSFLKNKDKTMKALKISFKSFEGIMPQFLGIIVVVGFLLAVFNPETISTLIGESSGFLGILFSSIIGSISMMPTFVAFSTGQTLLNNGAGYPQIGALITTLTMVGLMTYPLESKYIGKKAAFFRNLLAFFFAFVVAVFIEGLVNRL